MNNQDELPCKILILGDSKVGKSSIMNQFCNKKFSQALPPTLGIDYEIRNIKVEDKNVKLQIWDTAGQEKFRAIVENFYRDCQGVLIVFDLFNKNSFKQTRDWIMNIQEKSYQDVVICLIGNKLDLEKEDNMPISRKEISEFANALKIKHFLTSAKENINIQEAFYYLAQQISQKDIKIGSEKNLYEANIEGSPRCCN